MSDARSSERPTSPFLILLIGAATTVLATEWLRFQVGWTVATAPAVLGASATLVAVARSYRARRAWRRAREAAPAGEPLPSASATAGPPTRVQARPAQEEARPSVLRHDVPAPLLGPNDLAAGGADARSDGRPGDRTDAWADAGTEANAAIRPGRRRRERDRVETD